MKRRRRSGAAQVNTFKTWVGERVSLERSGVHLVALGLVIISLWLLASFVGQVIIGAQMDRRRDELSADITRIESENLRLATAVAYANSPAYAEQTARDQLGYAKEGDVIVLPDLIQPTAVPLPPTPIAVVAPEREANWRGWAHALFPPSSR